MSVAGLMLVAGAVFGALAGALLGGYIAVETSNLSREGQSVLTGVIAIFGGFVGIITMGVALIATKLYRD